MQKPKSFIASGLAVALVLSVSATVHGTDYTIGDPARGANNYDSLEAMRLANVVPADGDTITLYVDDRSLTYNWYVALSNDAVITVKSSDGTERIIGMGQHTGFIDDGGILNFNNIGNNVTLNLENVRFDGNKIEGNYYGTQGGAIYSAGSLVIQGESVVFSDNSVKENGAYNYTANGGAIYVEDDLTFSDGSYVFTQNTATGDEGIHAGYGGAVYAEENILFENGTYEFSGNSAIAGDGEQSGYGGAIFSDSGRIDFIDGTYLFSNNSAVGGAGYETGSGGAVWGDYLTFKNGTYTFSANTAVAGTGDESGFGGAVMAQYNLTFENGTYLFTGNSTIGGDGTYAGVGGAIWTNDLDRKSVV